MVCCRYEVIYKQVVSPEDIFLGMSNKNPTTASCEDMVVKIQLPEVSAKDIELNITEVFLDCRCPKWYVHCTLYCALPYYNTIPITASHRIL